MNHKICCARLTLLLRSITHERGKEQLFDSTGQGWVPQCQGVRERPKITSRRSRAIEKETSMAGWTSSNMAKAEAWNTDSAEVTVWLCYMSGSIRRQDDDGGAFVWL